MKKLFSLLNLCNYLTIIAIVAFIAAGVVHQNYLLFIAAFMIGFVKYADSQEALEVNKLYKQIVDDTQKLVEKHKEWHDHTFRGASITAVGEATVVKALDEIRHDPENGLAQAIKWLDKRQRLIEEIEKECEARGGKDLSEIYMSSLNIAQMIYDGEVDINRE